MRDFDFFAPYDKKTIKAGKAGKVRLIITGAIVCFICIVVLGFFYGLFKSRVLKQEIEYFDEIMGDPVFIKQVGEANKTTQMIEEVTYEIEFFGVLEDTMGRVHRVNENFMKFMGDQVVKDLFLLKFSIDNNQINIEGRANSKAAIAQFEYELRKTGKFTKVMISEIKKPKDEDEYYDFVMLILTKDVNVNED